MTTVLYGIRQCDSCRKAIRWLNAHSIAHDFHDVRRDGLDEKTIDLWLNRIPRETLVNKRSKTWHSLDGEARQDIVEGNCLALLQKHPTMIKRPVLTHKDKTLVGFDPVQYLQLFSGNETI